MPSSALVGQVNFHILSTKNTGIFEILMFEILTKC